MRYPLLSTLAASCTAACLVMGACAPKEKTVTDSPAPTAPIAKRVPQELEIHGDVRVDDYYWLKERDNPEVIAYLEAENEYTRSTLAHVHNFEEALFQEIVDRIKEDDSSVPYRDGDYFYYRRYEEGGEYPIYCRKAGSLEAPEEVLLDVNRLAEGHEYYAVRGVQVSSGQDILAYGVDTMGRRKYELRFRDLETGQDLPDVIPEVTANSAWANDNRTVFYSKQDPETLRWSRIYRHTLGSDPAGDELVYEEPDEEFSCWVRKTKSRQFLLLVCEQTLSSDVRYLDADDPEGEFQVFLARESDHEYSIDHLGDQFYVRSNDQATNFRLLRTPVGATAKANWVEVIPHREDTYLGGFELFRDHLVVAERRDGLIEMQVIPWDGSEEHYIEFGESAYDAYLGSNWELDTTVLRYGYTSLTTPPSAFDYDMTTREKTLLKEEEVLGGFDKARYATERLQAPADDGTPVPVSLVYRRDLFRQDGSSPLLLYGYGSYGSTVDPSFRSYRLSLIDRGFVFAIAHVRGGQIMGRRWYEDGKLLHKKNTFTDFVDVAEHLVAESYTSPDRLFARGGSAGGLLMGAVANLAPELFKGIVNDVPFVDVITTMLDPDIPLTTSEYDEWGNPNDRQAYDYMLSYSPYDRVEAKAYPNMLVTAGLHDSQVQYWEPAKYVAKLRTLKTDDNLLLLRTNMDAGHSGATGRFKRHRETALDYAFILDLMEIRE